MAKARILIVEDESIIAEDIRFSLEANGYEVCDVLDNGPEALKQAGRFKPDLVLLDIRIAGPLDGIETARQLEQQQIPVVFLTAHSDEGTLSRAKTTAPAAYLLKPFDERELCVTLEIALSKRPASPLLELPLSERYARCQRELANDLSLPELQLFRPESLSAAEFSDLSVDLLDTLCAIWLRQATDAQSLVSLKADDCLYFRGLQQQKSGAGVRAGYDDKSRREVETQLAWLAQLKLQQQPLIELQVTDKAYHWLVRPGSGLVGDYFSQRRSLLFAQRLLEYDPYRQKWEKRLARYLSWDWAEHQGQTSRISVGECLELLQVPLDLKNPQRTRERLELALETLQHDRLLQSWEYLQHEPLAKRGWLSQWQGWQLSIAPAAALLKHYAGLEQPPKSPLAQTEKKHSYGFIRHIRAERGLSQAEVASAIGLTQAQLSRIESGASVHASTAEKIKRWILEQL